MPRRRRGRPMRLLLPALVTAAVAALALGWLTRAPDPVGPGHPGPATSPTAIPARVIAAADCTPAGPWADAASANAASQTDLAWSLSGRDVLGWEIYAPLVGQEIASACPASSPGFAQSLARWQAAHALPATGRMDVASFQTMWFAMLRRRPFVQAMHSGCPAPAAPAELEQARPEETFGARTTIMAGRDALQAYRTMLAAARAEAPAIREDPLALKIVSGFRAPGLAGSDCPAGQTCFNLTRASCSAHRTGRAFDLYLGAAPGRDPTSTADDNRLYQSRTLAYRWLVRHAAQFGFLPYPYEPWHWEWAG